MCRSPHPSAVRLTAYATLLATAYPIITTAITAAAHACTRPSGVEPGTSVDAIDPAWITIPPNEIAEIRIPDATPADSTGTARTAIVTAIDIADAPSPQQKVITHAAGAPASSGT
jgi:hypothetical protein